MVAGAGADAIGLVFYQASPRYVNPGLAADIVQAVGPFVSTVGLFVNAEPDEIKQIQRDTGIHLLQFHGDESSEYCQQFKRPYIKAVRMAPDLDILEQLAGYPEASALLFDAWREDAYGGTGETFDWARLDFTGSQQAKVSIPLILAGGLNVDNVSTAVRTTRPYAVDVSSGVESVPGIKDPALVKQFIERVRLA